MGKTVILGASNNPGRYSFLAAGIMHRKGMEFIPVGIKKGFTGGQEILNIRVKPDIEDVDTVTIYMNPDRQKDYLNYIISLNPRRIIFNPGTENPELARLAQDAGITVVRNCTIVMLESGIF